MSGHVVHVVRSDAFAGVERYVADTANGLHARGWRVDVIGGDAARMRTELASGVGFHEGASVVRLAGALRAIGRCDVIHAHMTAAELPAALGKRRAGARLVVTRHFAGPRGHSLPGRLAAAVIAGRIDVQIAISEFVAAAIGEPATVLHNGVPPRDAPAAQRSRTVVTLHRLEREKDTAVALHAWARSGLGRQGWRLRVHGAGSEAAALRRTAAGLDHDDSVEFCGHTAAPREVLATAGLLLATAPAEPFGLTVVEAMAEATPVVAADGGAHRETLGSTGRYFAPGDAVGCARQLRELATAEEAVRAEVGRAGLARYRAHFTLERHLDGLVKLYRSPAPARAGAGR